MEITLAGGPAARPVAIRRDLLASSNSSEWRLDGVPSTAGAVGACVAGLRIQLDNLCQFLPQDRVADLARLPPTALLQETERALGDASLHALHADLAAAVAEEKAARRQAGALRAEAEAAGRAQEGGRAEAHRAERVDALQRRADAARGKIAWFKAAAASDAAEHARAMADRARELVAQAERGEAGAAAAGAAGSLAALVTAKAASVAAHTTAGSRMQRAERDLRKAVRDGPEALRVEVEAAREVLESAPTAAEEHAAKLARARAAEAAARAELDALPANDGGEGIDQEARAARAALQATHTDAMAAEKTAAAGADMAARAAEAARARLASLLNQAKRVGDARALRTRSLRSSTVADAVAKSGGSGAGPGGAWEGPVWGPLGAELAIPDPAAAAACEAATPFHVLRRFVVTTRADQARLVDIVKAKGESNPVSLSDAAAAGQGPPRGCDLHSTGLAGRGVRALSACISGPAPVLRALTDEVRLGSVLLAQASADAAAADAIAGAAKAAGARSVTFPGGAGAGGPTFHQFVSSRYSRVVNTRIESLALPAHLGPEAACLSTSGVRPGSAGGGGEAGGASLEDRVAAARGEVEATAAAAAAAHAAHAAAAEALTFEAGRLQAAIRAAATVEECRRAASTRLSSAARALTLVEAAADPAERVREAAAGLVSAAAAAPAALAAVTSAAAAYTAAAAAVAAATSRRAELEAAERVARRVKAAAEAGLARLVAMAQATAGEERSTLQAAERASAAARAVTGGPLESWPLAQEAGELPAEVEDLEAAAEAADAEVAGIAPTDARALERYRARAAAAGRLNDQASAATAEAEAAAATAAALRARWAPALRDLIATVDARFGQAMRALGCDGSVSLGDDDPGGDPAAARADVAVRFRPGEPLARLDGARQSGGERSVATILYLVALQAVSASPFRVVDEINQGMDPVNERAVFELLAREAAGAGSPQVLLLTPKLLPGLPLDDQAVTVLQVVNGPVGPGVGGPFGRVEAADLLPQADRAVGVR